MPLVDIFTYVTIGLLLTSLAGTLKRTPQQLLSLAFPYWLLSWLAQTFSAPLMLLNMAVLIPLALSSDYKDTTLLVISALTLMLFTFLHFRNWGIYLSLNESEHREISIISGLNPLNIKKGSVQKIKNIKYSFADKRNVLDIYMPKYNLDSPPTKNRPILLYIHGGAWITGNKESQGLTTLYHLAQKGWVCASINYRLAPKNRFPAMLHDALEAISWLNKHAERYDADPNFITITGGSAGGHIASLAALISGNPERSKEFYYATTNISAAISAYSRYDFLDSANIWGPMKKGLTKFIRAKIMTCDPDENQKIWELASPASMVNQSAPPFLIIHGSHDSLIPLEEARYFYDELKKISKKTVRYEEVKGAQHAFDILKTPASEGFALKCEAFLAEVHQKYLSNINQ